MGAFFSDLDISTALNPGDQAGGNINWLDPKTISNPHGEMYRYGLIGLGGTPTDKGVARSPWWTSKEGNALANDYGMDTAIAIAAGNYFGGGGGGGEAGFGSYDPGGAGMYSDGSWGSFDPGGELAGSPGEYNWLTDKSSIGNQKKAGAFNPNSYQDMASQFGNMGKGNQQQTQRGALQHQFVGQAPQGFPWGFR
jgi:hypothetical protein